MNGFEDVFVLDTDGQVRTAGLGLEHLAEGVAVDGQGQGDFEDQHTLVIGTQSLEVLDVDLLLSKDAGEHGDDLSLIGAVDRDHEGFGLFAAVEGFGLEIAGGNGEGLIFKRGEIVKKVKEDELLSELLFEIEQM